MIPAAESSWIVTIDSYDSILITARSLRQARWRAYRAFCADVTAISFAEFLGRGVTVRPATEFERSTMVAYA